MGGEGHPLTHLAPLRAGEHDPVTVELAKDELVGGAARGHPGGVAHQRREVERLDALLVGERSKQLEDSVPVGAAGTGDDGQVDVGLRRRGFPPRARAEEPDRAKIRAQLRPQGLDEPVERASLGLGQGAGRGRGHRPSIMEPSSALAQRSRTSRSASSTARCSSRVR